VQINQKKIGAPSRSIVLIGFIISLLAFTSCSAEENQPSESSGATGAVTTEAALEKQFKSISSSQAQEMMAQNKDLLVLDVRTPQERNQVRLADSTLVPIG